jgi:protein-disulfide isomerase
VRLVIRYMPFHANSVYAVGALEAAGNQGRYWEMLELMFQHHPEWASHHQPKPELLPTYAQQLGLDMAAFNAFIEGGEHKGRAEVDRNDGLKLGVRATPTFFVNGQMLRRLSVEGLEHLVEEALAR